MAWNHPGSRSARWLPVALACLGVGDGLPAWAQEPSVGAAPAPSSAAAAQGGTRREAQLEERIRQLESLIQRMPDPERVRRLEAKLQQIPDPNYVRQLEATVQQLSTQVRQLSTRLEAPQVNRAPARPGPAGGPTGRSPGISGGMASDAGVGEEPVGGAAGISPSAPPPSPRFDMPEPIPDIPLRSRFGPGFEFKTGDDEFNIQFHDLTQTDGRFYGNAKQTPVADTFGIARQWFIFSGHMTRPCEYYVSLANAIDTYNILDVFLNANFDRRLQFRMGRFKSPFTYEFYAAPVQALPNGEWSLFFNNFGMNRDVGAMIWGELFQYRLDYAVGLFNSVPNGFIDLSSPKDGIAYVNFAPWETVRDSVLENFNLGGSAVFGDEQHVPVPQELRTVVPTNGNSVLGVPFLSFNNNVLATGPRELWSLHLAYYYQQLSLLGEWQSGFQTYAVANRPGSTRLPIESFYIQAAYLLTGERVASRGLVRPKRPFDLRRGRFGPGAWELAGRFNLLELGDQVFTAGLADPNIWTNRLFTTDLGVSWYWNQYIRVLFDWQHAGFGNPVLYRPGGLQRTSDLFLIRFQIWF